MARIWILVVGALSAAEGRAVAQSDSTVTGVATPGIAPSAVPALLPAIRKELERRHCSIPQLRSDTSVHNVIQGRFRRPTELDWAVLCSVNGYSSVLVFWSGAPQHPSEVGVATDAEYTHAVEGGTPVFSRAIALADAARIPQPQSVPITHDGIRNLGPANESVIYYWDDRVGKWMILSGGD